jgi:hypothetical protein
VRAQIDAAVDTGDEATAATLLSTPRAVAVSRLANLAEVAIIVLMAHRPG